MASNNLGNGQAGLAGTTASVRQDEAAHARAVAIVDALDLAEKLRLVATYFPYTSPRREEFGMVLSSAFGPGVPRLAIPDLRITDASLGVANILNGRLDETSTALPCALAMAASFDPSLVEDASAMIGAEARAKTFNVLLAGGINLIRDPWAGRNFEYFSEDALLSGLLGAAAVRGVQSNAIASTLKHFVLNSQETGRMIVDARIDWSALRESDLLAFQIAIERGRPAAIMAAYNKVNGDWASENAALLTAILKDEWGYPGWVMSDWGGVHSTEQAALAGLDQESGMELDAHLNGAIFFTDKLRAAVEKGRVPEQRLSDMCTRILTGLIECGAFDMPVSTTPQAIDIERHAGVAQRVAERGIVLLRNRNLLPLAPTTARIAVIGGNADLGVLSGGGSSQVRSHGGAPIEIALEEGDAAWFCRMTYHASSPLDAIAAAAPDADVSFDPGDDPQSAARIAAQADIAIVFATQWRSEAIDLDTLALPDDQDALIAAVARANRNTIVVLETGGAVLMPWLYDVGAVLAAWYPGQRGGEAIAAILFGKTSPAGRLPVSFPAEDGDAPRAQPGGLAELRARDAAKAAGDGAARIAPFSVDYSEGPNIGYRWHEIAETPPLFPFGFGLTYTTFSYSALEVLDGAQPGVLFTLANIGDHAGVDIPQVYVQAADNDGKKSWRLAGFARLELEAGAVERIRIDLDPRTFSRWDPGSGAWRRDGGLRLAIARNAREFVLVTDLG